jgi:hypothetical protein
MQAVAFAPAIRSFKDIERLIWACPFCNRINVGQSLMCEMYQINAFTADCKDGAKYRLRQANYAEMLARATEEKMDDWFVNLMGEPVVLRNPSPTRSRHSKRA